jgi:hypothetical protein
MLRQQTSPRWQHTLSGFGHMAGLRQSIPRRKGVVLEAGAMHMRERET